jgi:hypothetical protein
MRRSARSVRVLVVAQRSRPLPASKRAGHALMSQKDLEPYTNPCCVNAPGEWLTIRKKPRRNGSHRGFQVEKTLAGSQPFDAIRWNVAVL